MATKKITLNELRILVKQIIKEETDVDRYSKHKKDLEVRLKKYAAEKEPDTNWVDIKNDFMDKADPSNTKTPQKAYDDYFKLVDSFLKKQGY
jgi:hypothetical protein